MTIRDRVYDKICEICLEGTGMPDCPLLECKWRMKLLSIKELAVVDREAELPEIPYCCAECYNTEQLAMATILKAGWVKEIKNGS